MRAIPQSLSVGLKILALQFVLVVMAKSGSFHHLLLMASKSHVTVNSCGGGIDTSSRNVGQVVKRVVS